MDLASALIATEGEWTGRTGWAALARLALDDMTLADEEFARFLPIIAEEIHDRPNRVREGMNSAMMAIGARSDALERQALAVARKVGKVHVDHGPTNCKTPNALTGIPKARAHRAKRPSPGGR